MIVVRILGDSPTVEQFVHHDEAHAVTQIQKLLRGRIMCGANGIDAKLFESFEATLPRAQRDSRAESTGVRVQADAFELEIFSVEPEACVGVEMKFADTKSKCLVVKRLASSSAHTRDGAIEIRV